MIKWKVQRDPINDTYLVRASRDGMMVTSVIDGSVKSLERTRFVRKYMVAQLKDYETKLLSKSWFQKLLDWARGY